MGLVIWLYLRALGLVYLVAFVSFWAQADGLVGAEGIFPVASTIDALRAAPDVGFLQFPTLSWLHASAGFTTFQCLLGALLSLALVLGLASALHLLALWLLYLSLVTIGHDFMAFQWDNLLLEAGLLAVFLAPIRTLLDRRSLRDPTLAIWLHRFLIFRLMFSSGLVKLTSGDPTWRGLDALSFHYETQPIPSAFSWYVHHFPTWFHEASVALVFVIQIGVSWLVFGPRAARIIAAWALALLQLLILLTGNYGFFNLLSLALLLLLLDDRMVLGLVPERLSRIFAKIPERIDEPPPKWRRGLRGVALASLLVLGALQLARTAGMDLRRASFRRSLLAAAAPFRSVNTYGLFAVMTTERPEIIVEGSDDGVTWKPYVFAWKPGPLDRNPSFVAPHMPRLDWQMWFAALGSAERSRWFRPFMLALLEAREPVLDLLEEDPFDGRPPRQVRATLWRYRFTPWERPSGHYWSREIVGPYFPPASR